MEKIWKFRMIDCEMVIANANVGKMILPQYDQKIFSKEFWDVTW
jgi:hypothetical protein